jgi:hypothetical protein
MVRMIASRRVMMPILQRSWQERDWPALLALLRGGGAPD